MKKILSAIFLVTVLIFSKSIVFAAPEYPTTNYVVKSGDSLWKISVRFQVGVSEIISANPQISNPDLIYPNQVIKVPVLDEVKKIENEVIRLTNIERSKKGLPALKANWQLSRVARYKSNDMLNNNYFSHTSPVYGSPFEMIKNFGIRYTAAGENIAKGQPDPKSVVNAWMNSSGHRANILSTKYTEIGVGFAKSKNGTTYWTQMFIKR